MHDRNLIWITGKGEKKKIKNMESSHLENVLNHIDKNINSFISLFGKDSTDYYKTTIRQERKLNRLNFNDDVELF